MGINVLGMRFDQLLKLSRDMSLVSDLDHKDVEHVLVQAGALWRWDYNKIYREGDQIPLHAQIPSGECSDGFVDVSRAICWPRLTRLFANQLIRKVRKKYHGLVECVVGSDQHGASTLSSYVADELDAIFLETTPSLDGQRFGQIRLPPGIMTLHVEGFVRTPDTPKRVREEVEKRGARFAPILVTVVDRVSSARAADWKDPIVSLLRYDTTGGDQRYTMNEWSQEECPLCRLGSERIQPRAEIGNWEKLNKVPST